jgi:hypothetical protein
MKDTGRITLTDEGRITAENGSSHRHGITVIVEYVIDKVAQTMIYHVYLNERVVRHRYDIPYSFNELYTVATEILFRNMYKGLPDLKINVEMGEPHG